MKRFSLFSSLVLFSLSTVSSAYTDVDVANAQYLARQGIVRTQSVTAQYRLDDTILRQEVIGIALKMRGIPIPEEYTCKKYFKDASQNDWVCRALELAADNGIISRANTRARPKDTITQSEALAILLKTGKISQTEPRRIVQTDGTIWSLFQDLKSLGFTQWQADMLDSLPSCEVINHGNSCEDGASTHHAFARFSPNTPSSRSQVFEFAALMLGFDVGDTTSDVLSDLEILIDSLPRTTQDHVLSSSALKNIFAGEALATLSHTPKVALVTFSDLECPFCARFETDVLYSLWTDETQNIVFSYKHFPLSFHPNASTWAQEAECVRKNLGDKAFFDYIHTRYLSPDASINTLAPSLTVNQIEACRDDEGINQSITDDQSLGNLYKVSGTPTTLVINLKTGYYEVVVGAQAKESVTSTIQTVLDNS